MASCKSASDAGLCNFRNWSLVVQARRITPSAPIALRAVDSSGFFRDVVQNQQIIARAWRDRVGATLIIAELDKRCFVVKLLNNRADLPAGEPMPGKIRQQCHHVQQGRAFVLRTLFRLHHSTQQETNLGTLSPVRTMV